MTSPTQERAPLVWRLPSWQPAVLFLVTAGLAAWSIYAGSSPVVRAITIVLGVAFFVAAVAAARMYVVADEEGVGVRRYAGETSVRWEEITGITITKLRGGALTLELQRDGEVSVNVPPSLVLPTKPTSVPKTRALLNERVRQLSEHRPAGK